MTKDADNGGAKLLLQLFAAFFKMGLFTFGGGLAMLPLIQRTAVQDKGWMTDEEMVDCVAVSQAMPGVIAINAATYIGNRKKGMAGAIAATLGVILPSFIIIILAVLFLQSIGENKYITGAFTGVKASSCALILFAALKLGKQVMKGWFSWALAIASFVAIAVFDITAVWAIIAGALLGYIYMVVKSRNAIDDIENENSKNDSKNGEEGMNVSGMTGEGMQRVAENCTDGENASDASVTVSGENQQISDEKQKNGGGKDE